MVRFDRPAEPENFSTNVNIQTANAEIKALFEAAIPNFVEKHERIAFPKKVAGRDNNLWGEFKNEFARSQHGRCGYCELLVIGGQPGDVEHYRPKGRVRILDPENPGVEIDDLSNVKGRKHIKELELGTGYWWKAYSWDNYLLSCNTCNRGWKKDFFPISGDPVERERPSPDLDEDALLLNPFSGDELADHLSLYTEGTLFGFYEGKTEKGVATIQTLGLNRNSLVVRRAQTMSRIHAWLEEWNNGSSQDVRYRARDIFVEGKSGGPGLFPGLTRIYFTQITGIRWNELESMIAEHDFG